MAESKASKTDREQGLGGNQGNGGGQGGGNGGGQGGGNGGGQGGGNGGGQGGGNGGGNQGHGGGHGQGHNARPAGYAERRVEPVDTSAYPARPYAAAVTPEHVRFLREHGEAKGKKDR